MIVDEMLAMGDMMRACFTYKRYMDDVVSARQSHRPFTVSALRAQELLEAADLLRQALGVLEPTVKTWLVHVQKVETRTIQ
jgi:hypothetical protein